MMWIVLLECLVNFVGPDLLDAVMQFLRPFFEVLVLTLDGLKTKDLKILILDQAKFVLQILILDEAKLD